ncbi:MAG: D-alanyl-D-alanine carboxypeptidase/D-alanyl-D-alanine-endopeptidase [Planctomycetes bacterium]|nr:D-alanyl-D-alanine carboxypeptidase/D-alanyl-D-alanine-endopeptidase [Planctomycetota bacterium]
MTTLPSFVCTHFAVRILPTLIAGLVLTGKADGQGHQNTREHACRVIEAVVQQPEYSNARFGVLIVSEPDGEVWFAHDADRGFIPASNTKLVSTALAWRRLGPDFRFQTALYRTGSVVEGVLHGDLVLRGSGDPTLGGRMEEEPGAHLRAFVDGVRSAGIRRVEGRVIGDDDAQVEEVMGEGWQWDYQHAWYAAQFGGLNLHENTFRAIVEPSGQGGFLFRAEPPCSLFQFRCDVVACLSDEKPDVEFGRQRGTNHFTARGRLGTDPWSYSLAVENPTLFAATSLRDALLAAGLEVSDEAFDIDDVAPFAYEPTSSLRVAVHDSAPLDEIVAITNTVSQNLYAEQLARVALRDERGRVPHIRETRRAFSAWLEELGLEPRTCYLADGSGMSRRNLFTPRALVVLLRAMSISDPDGAFLRTLPRSGVSGTLRSRLNSIPEGASVRAKTGSLSRVRALSGHVLAMDQVRFTFSILVNDYTISDDDQVVADIDRIVQALAEAVTSER